MQFVTLSAVSWHFPLSGRSRRLAEAWHALGITSAFVQPPYPRSAYESVFRRGETAVPILRPWPTWPRRWWPALGRSRVERSFRRRAQTLRHSLDQHVRWDEATAVVVSPVWAAWLAELPFRRVIYDCIDAPEIHAPRPSLRPMFLEWERALIERCDGAVVTAPLLNEHLQRILPGITSRVVPNGVDADWFRRQARDLPRPKDVPPPETPTVGFVGALAYWLDWPLIREVIAALPDVQFVFIGPPDNEELVAPLRALPNARFLGWRPYEQIPAYVHSFTACWVPFAQSNIGRAANPVKIYEYLALGKPVVTTPVADADNFGGSVHLAHSAEEMAAQLRAALHAPAANAVARQAYADRNTWSARAQAFAAFVESL